MPTATIHDQSAKLFTMALNGVLNTLNDLSRKYDSVPFAAGYWIELLMTLDDMDEDVLRDKPEYALAYLIQNASHIDPEIRSQVDELTCYLEDRYGEELIVPTCGECSDRERDMWQDTTGDYDDRCKWCLDQLIESGESDIDNWMGNTLSCRSLSDAP